MSGLGAACAASVFPALVLPSGAVYGAIVRSCAKHGGPMSSIDWWGYARTSTAAMFLVASMAGTAAREVPPSQGTTRDADSLYAHRAELANALDAAAMWEAAMAADRSDFESAWKLARACYWLGAHVASNERRAQYERGVKAGRRAVEINDTRPEGHFWLAANMGTLAESFGLRAGLRYRGPVKQELERVLALDPTYGQGLADRALGRWYNRVPGFFGGSKKKSVQHLQRALTYDPAAAATHFFLAETYLAMDRRDDAAAELERVLAAPLHPDWIPEVEEFKQRAERLLDTLKQR